MYNVTVAARFDLSLTYGGVHIRGSPFTIAIFGGLTTPRTCIAEGPGLVVGVVGFPASFMVRARDRFGNDRTSGQENVAVNVRTGIVPVSVTFST